MRIEIEQDEWVRGETFEDFDDCVVARIGEDRRGPIVAAPRFEEVWDSANFRSASGISPTHWEECMTVEQYEAFTGNEADLDDQWAGSEKTHHVASFFQWDGRHLYEVEDVEDFERLYSLVVILVPKETAIQQLANIGAGGMSIAERIDAVAKFVAAISRGEVWCWVIYDEDEHVVDSCGGYVGYEGYKLAQEESERAEQFIRYQNSFRRREA